MSKDVCPQAKRIHSEAGFSDPNEFKYEANLSKLPHKIANQ